MHLCLGYTSEVKGIVAIQLDHKLALRFLLYLVRHRFLCLRKGGNDGRTRPTVGELQIGMNEHHDALCLV